MKSVSSSRPSSRRFLLGIGGAAALVALTLAPACSSPEKSEEPEDLRRLLLQGLGTQVFVPRYVDFEERAADLDAAVADLCDAPSDDALDATREAWSAAREPWKRNEFLAFGPVVDAPLRAGPKIDFWPARVDTIEKLLTSDTALDADVLATRGSSERGLPVIEYLLFVNVDPSEDVFSADGRRCEYLHALTGDLMAQSTLLREAWDPKEGDYLSNLVEAGRAGKDFPSIEVALGEIVSRLVFIVENARGAKIGAVLGLRTDGTPQPDSAESRFSGRSIQDVVDNLRGVDETFFGADVKKAESLAAYTDRLGHDELPPKIRDALDASYAALDAIPGPLTEAVTKDPESVQAAVDALAALQRLFQVDLINALGVTLTFNDADGD